MRYRGKGLVAAACALSVVMTPGSVFASSFSSQYDQIQKVVTGGSSNSGNNTGNGRTSSQISGNNVTRTGTSAGGNGGPGSVQNNNSGNSGLVSDLDKSADALPSVKEVSLSEQYYSDYDMYEESIDGQYFFYSNTGNGSITDKNVYIDIPSNLEYTVELDGNPITYQSNALLSAKGTYVFRFHAVTGSNALAGQTDYSATFRFRIQDKPPQKAGEGSENSLGSSGSLGSIGSSGNSRSANKQEMIEALQSGRITASELADALGISVSDLPSYLGLGDVNSITDANGNVIGGVAGSDGTGESSSENDVLAGLLGSDETEGESESASEEDQTDNGGPQEAVKEAIAQAAANKGGRGNGDGLAETWDAVTGFYAETLFTGTEFDSNVQNGATVNGSVYFRFPAENTLIPTLTKNGEVVEYTPGDEITEDGWYCLKLADTVPEYETVYDGLEAPRFYFQIINHPVNDLELLFVPKGEHIVSLEKDGNFAEASASYAKFGEDGEYTLTYTTKSGDNEVVSLTKDTTPPRVLVTLSGGKAEVQIQEENVTATLYKDGAVVDYTDTITEPGSYELHVKDEAGNESVDTFTIRFRLSLATVIAVMLIIAIAAGIVAFVIKVRKHTSIRE